MVKYSDDSHELVTVKGAYEDNAALLDTSENPAGNIHYFCGLMLNAKANRDSVCVMAQAETMFGASTVTDLV